jgi:hypothetical protein
MKLAHFFGTMLTEEMEHEIGLGNGSGRATRAGDEGSSFLGVAGCNVESKSGGLGKLFVAEVALERESSLVCLEMVMHSILAIFRNAAVWADVGACGGILLICIWHLAGVA